jgi:glyoxylase-like metal-dependent hydrolase (beta-lactamase superfamily II)
MYTRQRRLDCGFSVLHRRFLAQVQSLTYSLANRCSMSCAPRKPKLLECYNSPHERRQMTEPQSTRTKPATPRELIHITLPVGLLQCNCTIIGDPLTLEGLVIDPGDEVARITDLLARHNLTVKAIVSTHAHIDHVGGLSKLHRLTGAPVLMHQEDLPLYQAMEMQAAFLGVAAPEITSIDNLLKEGDTLRWGDYQARVIHTPGHTPGSVCLYIPQEAGTVTLVAPQLFAGDTLFAGSIGRTDLWGGSMPQIMDSLRGKLLQLPDSTVVYPGHGPATTIGTERHSNPFLIA